jgi:hypothetical protein
MSQGKDARTVLCNIFLLIVVVSLLFASNRVAADSIVTGTHDECTAIPGVNDPKQFTSTETTIGEVTPGTLSYARNDLYTVHHYADNDSSEGDISCGVGGEWTIFNSITPPEVGSNSALALPEQIVRSIQATAPRMDLGYDQNVLRYILTPSDLSGPRLALDSSGFSLTETSVAAYVVFEETIDRSPGDPLMIPFVVDSAGDGDWLAFYAGSEMFWKQPISNFEVGSLYFANVPLSAFVPDGDQILTFRLHVTGETNASVYFPQELTPVPIPTAFGLFISAASVLGFMRRKQIT